MNKSNTAWECQCGVIAYGKLPPVECSRCDMEDSFVEVDEEELDSLADEHLIGEIRGKDWGEEE